MCKNFESYLFTPELTTMSFVIVFALVNWRSTGSNHTLPSTWKVYDCAREPEKKVILPISLQLSIKYMYSVIFTKSNIKENKEILPFLGLVLKPTGYAHNKGGIITIVLFPQI